MDIAFCAPADLHVLAAFSGVNTSEVAPGFGSTMTTPLIMEFLHRGNHVTLYTLSKGIEEAQKLQWGNLKVCVAPARTNHRARDFFRAEIASLQRMIEADQPRFVHAHWTYEFALAPLRLNLPTLVTIHDLPWQVFRHFKDLYRAIRMAMAYEVAVRGKYFTAVSSDAAAHFRRYFRFDGNVAVIPNGLPDKIFEQSGLSPRRGGDEVVFATILQGWSRRKNPIAALEAFARVQKEIPNARFQMYGTDYETGGPAHSWAVGRNLQKGVSFIGVVPHEELLRRINAEVDIIVHPSLDEAFSMTILEAMALRKPVLVGDSTPGMHDMLAGGTCGILTDVRDHAGVAEQMRHLALDRDYRIHLGQSGFDHALSHFQLQNVASQYESLYHVVSEG